MLRCIEQKVCNTSYMQPNQKIKLNDWYKKVDPPMWIAADFECMNVPINDNNNNNDDDNSNDNVNVNDHENIGVTDKLFVNKPVAIGYIIVKNLDYDNTILKKDDHFNCSEEDCVEWFINEMLEKEGYMKNYFEIELEINLDTVPGNYDQKTCGLCGKEFTLKDMKEKPNVKDHCHLTGKLRDLAHNNCSLNTRKAHTSFVLILFHNFSGYDCHLIFEKINKHGHFKHKEKNENGIIAKASEKYISIKIGCLTSLDSYRFFGR